jgi:hypothetical protein
MLHHFTCAGLQITVWARHKKTVNLADYLHQTVILRDITVTLVENELRLGTMDSTDVFTGRVRACPNMLVHEVQGCSVPLWCACKLWTFTSSV